MRSLMTIAALLAVGGCNRGAGNNVAAGSEAAPVAANNVAPAVPAAAPVAAEAAARANGAGLPADFPGTDLAARGADCVVYLGLSREADARPGGHDDPAMAQAQGQWRAALARQGGMNETEIQQLVGSSVNPLMGTPAAQRDAASVWCVANAPEVDPTD